MDARLGAPQKLDPSEFEDYTPEPATPASPEPDASVPAPAPGGAPAPKSETWEGPVTAREQVKVGKPQKIDPSEFTTTNTTVGNIGRGLLERTGELIGGTIQAGSTGMKTLGGYTEGIPVVGPAVTAIGAGMAKKAKAFRDLDLGAEEMTVWQDVVDKPLRNVIPFALEQGILSAPDIAAVFTNLPGYIVARSGEISYDRARNDNRDEPTGKDLIAALPAATISAMLEKVGASKMLGLGEVALTNLKKLPPAILKAMLVEGTTEAIQEPTEYTGETLGTARGWKLDEAALRSLQGWIVGTIFGSVVRAGTGGVQIAANKLSAQPEPDQTGNPATPGAPGQDTPGDVAATPPPPPPGTGGGGTVNPNAPAPRPTGTPGWQSDEEARRAEQAKRDWRQKKINEQQQRVPKGVDPAVAAATAAASGARPAVNQGLTPTPARTPVIVGDEIEGDEEGAIDEEEEVPPPSEAMQGILARHKGDPDVVLAAQQAAKPVKQPESNLVTSDMVPTSGAAVRQAGNLAPEPGSPPGPPAPAVPVKTPVSPAPLATAEDREVARQARRAQLDADRQAATGQPAESLVPPATPEPRVPQEPAPRAPSVALEGTGEPVQVYSNEDIDRLIAEQEAADEAAIAASAATGQPKLGAPQVIDESEFETPTALGSPTGTIGEALPKEEAPKPTITLKGKPPEIKGPTEIIKRGSKEVVVEKATPSKAGKASVVGKQIAEEVTRKRKAKPKKADESLTDAISLAEREALRERARKEAEEDERVYQEVLAQVSEEIAAERQKGAPPAKYVKESVERAERETESRVEARRYEHARAEEARITAVEEAEANRAKEAEQKKQTEEEEEFARQQGSSRTTQYKSKTGNAIRKEGVATTLSAWSKNKDDPDLAEWHKAYLARQQVTGGQKGRLTGEKKSLFDGLTMLMKQHNEARAQKVDAAAEAKAAEGRAEQEKVRESQGAAPREAPKTEAARIKEQAEAASFAERVAKIRKPLQDAISKLPPLNIPKGTGVREAGKLAREWAAEVADQLRRAVTRTGGARTAATNLKQKVDVANTPEENLAIYAQAVKKMKGGLSYVDLMEAMRLYGEGKYADMVNFMGDAEAALVEEEEITDKPPEGQSKMPIFHMPMEEDEDFQHPFPGQEGKRRKTTAGDEVTEEVTRDDGSKETATLTVLHSTTGSKAMDFVSRLKTMTGWQGWLQRMQIRRLKDLVGDIEIRFVSDEDIHKLDPDDPYPAAGLYKWDKQAQGGKPAVIYINAFLWDSTGPGWRGHVLMHEMTHAATVLAVQLDLHGAGKMMDSLRKSLQRQLIKEGKWDGLGHSLQYGFTNVMEFVAESYSNANFQQLLASYKVPLLSRFEVGMTTRERGALSGAPTWWGRFVASVSNALGMVQSGIAPHKTYLASTIALHPVLMRSLDEQYGLTMMNLPMIGMMQGVSPQTMSPLIHNAAAGASAVMEKLDVAGIGDFFSRANKILSTTQNNRRRWVRAGGQEGDAFTQLSDLFQKMAGQTRELAEGGEKIVKKLMELRSKNAADADLLATTMLDGTRFTVDVAAPLTHANNSHISKKGFKDRHKRAAHARGAAEHAKLSPEAKRLYQEMKVFYKLAEDQRVVETVKQIISNVIKPKAQGGFGVVLPPGVSAQDAIDWVVNGAIDRPVPADPQNRQPGERTLADDAMHKALGKSAKSLEGSKGLRKIHGLYVPLSRWGGRFFAADETIPVPAGAVRETGTINEFLFDQQANLDRFQDSSDWTMDVTSEWWDPNTGKKGRKTDPGTVQIFRAKVQNRVMHMSDNKSELNKLRKELLANPNFDPKDVTEVLWTEKDLHSGSEILPAQIRRLLNSVQQGAKGNKTAQQDAIEQQIIQAYIRQLGGQRASHRRLKRRNVRGYSHDMAHATLSYAHTWASHLTNLRNGDKIADLEEELRKDYTRQAGKMAGYKQNMVNELIKRIKANNGSNDVRYGKALQRGLLDVSFMNHLATVAYSAVGLTQNFAVTHPVLASKFGYFATMGALTRAMWNMGAAGTLARGAAELAAETRHVIPSKTIGDEFKRTGYDYMTYIKRKLRHVPGFDRVLDEIHAMGFGFASGLETEAVAELERGRFGKFLGRSVAAARALPHAVEVVNRVVTALAAFELGQRSGMTQDQARQYAVDVTEQTQGGYSAENNPVVMTHGLGGYARIPFQFKKYPLMYGQLYYDSLVQMLAPTRKGDRALYAKQFMYLTMHGLPLAGLFGMPLVEFAKGFVQLAAAIGAEDDWEDWENWMQDMANDYLDNDITEAMLHGWSRLADIDLSGRLSNSNLILFGEPDKYEEADVKAWWLDQLLGAGGTMAFDAAANIHNHEWAKAVPMPAFMKDFMKAYEHYSEGYISKRTGKKYAEETSLGEAVGQAFGFRPASEARQYETGGGGARHKARERVNQERTSLMQRWVDNPSKRPSIYAGPIARFNREHPDEKITRGGLQRSMNKRRQDERERRREEASP